jgi:hypothetical protein
MDIYAILPPEDSEHDDLLDYVYEVQDNDVTWTPKPDDVAEELISFFEEVTIRCPQNNDPDNPLEDEDPNAAEYLFTENICHISTVDDFPEEVMEYIEAIAQKNGLEIVTE